MARSRRLGAQPPHLFSPLELVRQAAAHVVSRDPPAFLVLYCAPAFLCLPPVLVGLVVETLVLPVDTVLLALLLLAVPVAAVMVTVPHLAVVVFLLVVVLLLLRLPDLSVAVLLRQELRLHLVAAEADAAAPLGSGEM